MIFINSDFVIFLIIKVTYWNNGKRNEIEEQLAALFFMSEIIKKRNIVS